MRNPRYRRCAFDGEYHHPDEIIYVPIEAAPKDQKGLCLLHAERFLKHLIKLEELKTTAIGRRRVA
jgi:hypothetical protein